MKQANGEISLYVDGPFRCPDGRVSSAADVGYRVQYDFVISVPEEIQLTLRTVNGGEITSEKERGDFHVRNVNGGVSLQDLTGAGSAHTVNGKVVANFATGPSGPVSFRTVNGAIESEFPAELSADLRFRTRNGDVHTDFASTALPTQPAEKGAEWDEV